MACNCLSTVFTHQDMLQFVFNEHSPNTREIYRPPILRVSYVRELSSTASGRVGRIHPGVKLYYMSGCIV